MKQPGRSDRKARQTDADQTEQLPPTQPRSRTPASADAELPLVELGWTRMVPTAASPTPWRQARAVAALVIVLVVKVFGNDEQCSGGIEPAQRVADIRSVDVGDKWLRNAAGRTATMRAWPWRGQGPSAVPMLMTSVMADRERLARVLRERLQQAQHLFACR